MITSRHTGLFNLLAAGSVVLAGAAYSAAPPEGSEQMNYMAPYVDFVRSMRTANDKGSCCDLSDGRANLQEKTGLSASGQPIYRVHVTRAAYAGLDTYIPPEGKWVEVYPSEVLTPEHAKAVCDKLKKENPAKAQSCNQPPFNLLWFSASGNKVYCYWPVPKDAALPVKVKTAELRP